MKQHYTVFSDESYITGGERYQSISSVSLPSESVKVLTNELVRLFVESNVKEFKWAKLANAKYRFAAIKIYEHLINNWILRRLRIDTLIWDTQDKRHDVPGRDDTANLGRMYFHLLKVVMEKREAESIWSIFPDEHVALDWHTLHDCIKSVGNWTKVFQLPIFGVFDERKSFYIEEFRQVQSKKAPICQASDFFAGISVFSINKFKDYKIWLTEKNGQLQLFKLESTPKLSNRDKERFPVLHSFVSLCKLKKLGVSIESKKRLWTPNPNNPINFWYYVPQHERDKAPIRGRPT